MGYTNLADLEALHSPGGVTPGRPAGTVRLLPRLLVERDLDWPPPPPAPPPRAPAGRSTPDQQEALT